ncbi:MAG: bis(5'-nucleosyl)-tetraphosphatase (symmetrical) YqeK [Eubacteriales bacterium]|nr:bis(5'-nucleosyl)-tetraphosphatase (symmetrical) YqeK [Eubacteriales bacterium]
MSTFDLKKIENKLYKELDEDRYQHTLGVMYTSAALAMAHHTDIQKALLAGLLHDCAKCIPNKKKIKLCRKNNLSVSDFEEQNPFLLHAKLGAYLAKTEYGVDDVDVIRAITYHTTGRPDMSVLEKIVYIADYIEPMRCKAPRLEEIRAMAYKDLDECIYEILKDTLDYLEENPKEIDQTTVKAFHYYKTLHMDRQGERSMHE